MNINIYPVPDPTERTPFNEQLTAQLKSSFNLKPTWGITDLREDAITSGTLASIEESGGEIKISTGLDAGGVARLTTAERGQYQAGTQGQCGVAVRIPVLPSGSQDARWGYFDESNGFGFGIDTAGLYTFSKRAGSISKTYQEDWSISPNIQFSPTSGAIYHIDFTWYGYGNAVYGIAASSGLNDVRKIEKVHRFSPATSVSVEDPNQPITVEAFNGDSAQSGNFEVYVGGRQFSVITGDSTPEIRTIHETVTAYTTTSGTNIWEPIMTIRPKATHGPSNRRNSVFVTFDHFDVISDQAAEVRVDLINGPTTYGGGGYKNPDYWTSEQSAVEVKSVQYGGTYGCPSGLAIAREFVSSSKAGATDQKRDAEIPLHYPQELTLWVRRIGNQQPIISAIIGWIEQW